MTVEISESVKTKYGVAGKSPAEMVRACLRDMALAGDMLDFPSNPADNIREAAKNADKRRKAAPAGFLDSRQMSVVKARFGDSSFFGRILDELKRAPSPAAALDIVRGRDELIALCLIFADEAMSSGNIRKAFDEAVAECERIAGPLRDVVRESLWKGASSFLENAEKAADDMDARQASLYGRPQGFDLLPEDARREYGVSEKTHNALLCEEIRDIGDEAGAGYPDLDSAYDIIRDAQRAALDPSNPEGPFNGRQISIIEGDRLGPQISDETKKAILAAETLGEAVSILRDEGMSGEYMVHYLAAADDRVDSEDMGQIFSDAGGMCEYLSSRCKDAAMSEKKKAVKKFMLECSRSEACEKNSRPSMR